MPRVDIDYNELRKLLFDKARELVHDEFKTPRLNDKDIVKIVQRMCDFAKLLTPKER